MKIVTWNMGYNTNASHQDAAWDYLIDELQPDIALVQEVVVPKRLRDSHVCVFTPPTKPAWGSAIVVKGLPAVQLEPPEGSLLHRFKSRITVASVQVGTSNVLVASVHPSTMTSNNPMLDGVDPALATPTGDLWESDVMYAGLQELTKSGQQFIIGGDWMQTWLWDTTYRTTSHAEFFERAASGGWVESTSHWFGVPQIDLRTWYGKRGKRNVSTPYQDDRIFLDKELATHLSDCEVFTHPAQCLGLSDHAPLVIELDV